ncbi:MAG: methionyl-tRNA formyltransferase [Mogibacterium sp.]|nr:methionyl-tRNA formyltransferase [Mogibacterium sp.]MBR0341601.1 methionyl-tRNA formyltransferase [Oscillospiraceae bacterium]
MRIVFMGTPAFAACSLQKLIDDGYEIPLVVTQPDRKGNRNRMVLSEVRKMALEHGIETAQPVRIKKDPELIEKLRMIAPDMIVVAAFGQILPKSVLDIPRLGCINVHGSLLPKLRGASPMQAAVLEGLDESGVTIMRMAEGLDTGDMISKCSCDIKGKDFTEVSEILAEAGAALLAETIPHIADGTAVYEVQNDSEATYAGMISKTDGFTDFNEDAERIERKIRAFIEWPACYSYLDGQQIKFYKAQVIDEDPDGEPGTVSRTDKNSYFINCRSGKLRVLEQQLQGKKRMSAGDFMRGHKLSNGDRFGAEEEK